MSVKTILSLFLLIVLLPACYEDGPLISFRSKDKRVCGDWQTSAIFINGEEHESEAEQRIIRFLDDGSYLDVKGDSSTALYTNTGSWQFSEDKKQLLITIHDDFTGLDHTIAWDILRLAYKELRLSNTSGSVTTGWWLERKE